MITIHEISHEISFQLPTRPYPDCIHHIQIYSSIHTFIAKSLQARSAGTSTHKWLNWQAWNPFGCTSLPVLCRQMNDNTHKYMTAICEKLCVWTGLSCLAEISAAGSVTRDTTWQIAIKDSVWWNRSWKHPNNWFLSVFCECRGCNNLWMTFCLHWGNTC